MASATKSAERAESTSPQSQWALVAREFCKRRLAVVAGLIILALVTISVFAPLLANDRPLYFVGINRFEFRESARTLRGIVGQLANVDNEKPAAAGSPVMPTRAERLRTARLQISLMSADLGPEEQARLREVQTKIEAAVASTDRAQASTQLRELQRELRPLLDSYEPKLVTRTHWPVFDSLKWIDLLFMTATVLVLFLPAWTRLPGLRNAESGPKRILIVLCLIPVVCAAGWRGMVPDRVDRTDYKAGVLVADDTGQKAGVIYQSVMWPPIAYALDEYDLAGKSAAPAWYPDSWRPKSTKRGNPAGSEAEKKIASRWSTPHWMGTDESGRDVLCRMIWGGRVSLSVGIVAVAIYVSIGIVVGALAGYFRGIVDLILSRIIEVVICFPSFFLILTIVAMVGPGLFNIMVVIGLTGWTGIARLVRGEFLRLVDQEFVLAGRALGYSPLRLIFRHVLPNAMAPVLVSATFGIAGAILTESGLSFLGLGISKPTPSWGSLLADGREALDHAPWLIHFPGLAIFITITAYNLIGEALRDAADPRLRGSR